MCTEWMEKSEEGWRRQERGRCRALSASAAALILHYGLGAMKSYSGEITDIQPERQTKARRAAQHQRQRCDSAVSMKSK